MPAGRLRITRHQHVPDTQLWDSLVDLAAAPVFYRAAMVAAYDSKPLLPTLDSRYFIAWENDDPVAVLPFYLVTARDPFSETGQYPLTWAISHFWHCYDTRLPALSTSLDIMAALWDEMAQQADDWGADQFGFINTDADGPESAALAPLAARRIPRKQRYRISLSGVRDFSEHLARLPRAVRQDARRQLRRAELAQVTGRVYRSPVPQEVVDRVCELLEFTAVRYNPGYYERLPIAHLLSNAGATVRVPVLEIGSKIVAASVSFHDGSTLHNWAVGVEPDIRERFSPYLVLLKVSMNYALAENCKLIELGRTNPEWKQRVGATPVELVTWMGDLSGKEPGGAAGASDPPAAG